jgi:hypothetical protein
MKRLIPYALILSLSFCSLGNAEDVSFEKCKLADAKGTQTRAALVFSDSTKEVIIRAAGRVPVSIPYATLDKVSYEYSKKHRITTGAILFAITPFGVGALVMLTKSKSDWLYVDFRDQDGKKSVVLKLEKKDLTAIFDSFKSHTGKEVVNLGEAGKG